MKSIKDDGDEEDVPWYVITGLVLVVVGAVLFAMLTFAP
jgi:hypothetical protein